jgi:hypothetical protein
MIKYLVTLLIAMSAVPVAAKDLFVSTTGSDAVSYANNDIDNPWATVEKAWADAQTNDVVYYRAGTYTITTQIDNLTSGSNVTHTNYQDESVTWASSLCADRGVIMVSENNITVDGINGTWTGAEFCFADTGFFVMGWASKAGVADYFTLKNGTWTFAKYGQNGGIVFARQTGEDVATHVTIENVKITGTGVFDCNDTECPAPYGSMNTCGIMMFESENWAIKNCEISNVNTGIFYNKHANADDSDGGTVQNTYIHTVGRVINTQANYTDFVNNIFDGSFSMGYDSGASADGNIGSDYNTFTHNTIIGSVTLEDKTRSGDNALPGAQYNEFENNILISRFDVFPYGSGSHNTSGDYNLYGAGVYNDRDTYTVAEWQAYNSTDANSIAGTPTFVGGASPETIAGFALTSESAGYQACADSSDMGADVSLVGADVAPPDPDPTPGSITKGGASTISKGGASTISTSGE